jgi:1,4-alpha-glucan branching enzyme
MPPTAVASASPFVAEKSVATTAPVDSTVPGMGAMLHPDGGVAFRVWAPNADAISVTGTFNQWDATTHPFVREAEGGTWYLHVPEAKAGDEYLFHLRRGEQEMTRIDPWARKVTNSIGKGVLWWPNPEMIGPRPKPLLQSERIIYELHVGSFNAEVGKGPGTFDSVIEKLPYLRDLGINVIEVMPVAEFAGDFSWGYNPAHPFAVESAYGGPEKFQALIKAAHEHGISVILDVVYNHFGPSDLSLWQFDGWSENDGGGIYFYNDWKAKTPWGNTRPDYGRGEVRTYIRDNAMMWVRDFGVDGLRWDMSVYIRTVHGDDNDPGNLLSEGWNLMGWINDDLRKEFPGFFTVAEDLHNSEALVKPTEGGGAGFSAQWDAAFVHPVRAVMITGDDTERSLDAVIGALKNAYDGDSFKRVVYSESHDEVSNGKARLPSEIAPGEADGFFARKRTLLGAGLVLTCPGIPMLFQGQEFLEDEWFRDSVPLDWKKLERFAGVHAFFRDLIALRLNRDHLSKGLIGAYLNTHHVDHDRKVLAFHRRYDGGPGDDVIVVMNLSNSIQLDYPVGVPAAGLWRVRLNSDGEKYSPDFKNHPSCDVAALPEPIDGMEHRIVTGLGPYSMVIYTQDHPAGS